MVGHDVAAFPHLSEALRIRTTRPTAVFTEIAVCGLAVVLLIFQLASGF